MPFRRNVTPATPTLSEAEAATVRVPTTLDPFAGEVRLTVGAVVSALFTVTFTTAAVAVFPAASRATAVSVWEPFCWTVLVQVREYGALGIFRAQVGAIQLELDTDDTDFVRGGRGQGHGPRNDRAIGWTRQDDRGSRTVREDPGVVEDLQVAEGSDREVGGVEGLDEQVGQKTRPHGARVLAVTEEQMVRLTPAQPN